MDRLPHRVALIGNYPPRQCGLATFTQDVRAALEGDHSDRIIDVYAMNDRGHEYSYPDAVVGTIAQDDLSAYARTGRQIVASGADLICVQHEYGIFGGPAGSYLLALLKTADLPVVVTLHTVLEHPDEDQRAVIEALAARADYLVVMAEKGRELLRSVYGVRDRKIAVVPHGAPDRQPGNGSDEKRRFGLSGHSLLLTFGLLSPNKGVETMIRALPAIVERHPDALYVVLGATHPHLIAHEGEAYRNRLKALARKLGVEAHVHFVDGFVDQDSLLDWLTAADVYVTPYLCETQITSGTLSYAVALGCPIVSTPYWHAAELLSSGCGLLAPFGDDAAFAQAVIGLLDDPLRRAALAAKVYALGRSTIWPRFAERYGALFEDCLKHKQPGRIIPVPYGKFPAISAINGPRHPPLAQPKRPQLTLRYN